MNISQIDPDLVLAITSTRELIKRITGRRDADISVSVGFNYGQAMEWSINVFQPDFSSIYASGADLDSVVAEIREKHEKHVAKNESANQVMEFAKSLGLKVEVVA